MKQFFLILALTVATATAGEHRFRLLGLFQPDRVADLQIVIDQMEGVDLVKVDFELAEATFEIEDDELAKQFEQRLRGESQGTFEALPLSEIPPEKLEEVKIEIVGLDCKGCSYGAYVAIYKIEGVERATANFGDGTVVAWIDPEKTNRAALEDALTQRRVTLKNQAEEK